MNALMGVAVTGAFLIGQWPEAAMVMALYAIAELIEARSVDRARNAIKGLLDLTAGDGWLKIAQVLIKAAELKTPIVVLDWDRTVEEQRLLVARGASQTMDSKHLEGLAVDFCFLQDLEEDGEINWEFDRYAPLG